MTRFAQLWRTSTVRLTALFILIFVVFSVLLLGIISFQSSIQIQQQQQADIDREVRDITRIDANRGFRATILAVDRLSRHLDRARRSAFERSELDSWEFDVLSALRRAGSPYVPDTRGCGRYCGMTACGSPSGFHSTRLASPQRLSRS